jgi:hexosaminidase
MKKHFSINAAICLFTLIFICNTGAAQTKPAIIPEPVSLVEGKGTFVIDIHTSLVIPSGSAELIALGNSVNEWINALVVITLP